MLKGYSKEAFKVTFKMAIPSIIESFFVSFAGLVDSLMVSNLDSNAVAGVGLTTQPKFIGLAVFLAMNVAVSALVARRFGQQERKKANAILVTSLTVTLILAVIISIVSVTFADTIITWCGSTEETHKYAADYLRIIMGGMIFNCIQLAINAAQRGAGNTKITMRTNVTSNVINIIFNYLLIEGHFGFPRLEIHGAAIATVLGTVVAAIMSIISVTKPSGFISIPFIIKNKIKPTLEAITNILKVGYSVFFEQILMRIGFLATALMAADQGADAMAAHQVGMNIMSLSFAFGDGLQAAAVALIGRSLGENSPDKAKLYGRTCQFTAGVISIVLAVMFFFGAKPIMTLFFKDKTEIIGIGVSIVYIIIFTILFQIRQVVYLGALRGAGDTLYTAIVCAVSVTVIRTVVSYLCGYTLGWGIHGVWLGITADQIVRMVLVTIRFKKGKWAKIKI